MRFDHRRGLTAGTEDTHPGDGEDSAGMVLERDTTPVDGRDTIEDPHPGDGEDSAGLVLERHMTPEKVTPLVIGKTELEWFLMRRMTPVM